MFTLFDPPTCVRNYSQKEMGVVADVGYMRLHLLTKSQPMPSLILIVITICEVCQYWRVGEMVGGDIAVKKIRKCPFPNQAESTICPDSSFQTPITAIISTHVLHEFIVNVKCRMI